MEEIEKLKSRGLDEYFKEDKYLQTDDLLPACAVKISCSLTDMLKEIHIIKGTGKPTKLNTIAKNLQIAIQHIAIFAHCLDLAIPEEEEIDEFIEDEIDDNTQMDATLTLLGMLYICSNMALEYYNSELEEDNSFDWEMMSVGIVGMLAQAKVLCNRFKMDFVNVITKGENL